MKKVRPTNTEGQRQPYPMATTIRRVTQRPPSVSYPILAIKDGWWVDS